MLLLGLGPVLQDSLRTGDNSLILALALKVNFLVLTLALRLSPWNIPSIWYIFLLCVFLCVLKMPLNPNRPSSFMYSDIRPTLAQLKVSLQKVFVLAKPNQAQVQVYSLV